MNAVYSSDRHRSQHLRGCHWPSRGPPPDQHRGQRCHPRRCARTEPPVTPDKHSHTARGEPIDQGRPSARACWLVDTRVNGRRVAQRRHLGVFGGIKLIECRNDDSSTIGDSRLVDRVFRRGTATKVVRTYRPPKPVRPAEANDRYRKPDSLHQRTSGPVPARSQTKSSKRCARRPGAIGANGQRPTAKASARASTATGQGATAATCATAEDHVPLGHAPPVARGPVGG